MKTVNPSYEIITPLDRDLFNSTIENAARICYKSEDKISQGSAQKLIMTLIRNGHEAMLEHAPNIAVKFRANRGFTHEIVRMRLASFAQESTRYVNYSKGQYGSEITICKPDYIKNLSPIQKNTFFTAWQAVENAYLQLIKDGVKPQIARDILPIGVKADIVVTCNVRQWRHILRLRTEDVAHPIMHEIMRPLLAEFQRDLPELFTDIVY